MLCYISLKSNQIFEDNSFLHSSWAMLTWKKLSLVINIITSTFNVLECTQYWPKITADQICQRLVVAFSDFQTRLLQELQRDLRLRIPNITCFPECGFIAADQGWKWPAISCHLDNHSSMIKRLLLRFTIQPRNPNINNN